MEEDAKVYRERAEQARMGAREATRPDFRAVFERLAASYEDMARAAEWLETGKPAASASIRPRA